jgi:diaminopimelate decarboxylase
VTHSTVARYEVRDGYLCVGGVPLDRLTARVGSTPYFAYDRALVHERVTELREALGPRVSIGYAVKANPMPAMVQLMSGLVDCLDVASAGELRVALDTGIASDRVSFAGPGKTDAELTSAIAAGAVVELESAREATRAVAIGQSLGIRPRVAVRVPSSSALTPRTSLRSSSSSARPTSTSWGSTSSPARRTCTPRSSWRRRRGPWTWYATWRRTCRAS